jgi:hypothetical protein
MTPQTDALPGKKRRAKKARAKQPDVLGADTGATPQPADIVAFGSTDDPASLPMIDAENQVIEIPNDDGTVTINLAPVQKPKRKSNFDDNIAEHLDSMELGRICEDLLQAIGEDDNSRSEWLQQRADGLDLLGLKVEKPGGSNVGSSSTAVAGQSRVRDSILAEACDLFQANSYAELCPSDGPVKAKVVGDETTETQQLAQALEDDLNFYLTGSGPGTAKEYYPDTRKMLWWTGYASGMFKKVYRCPLRRRPVSESVDGADIIVPPNVTDLSNAGRITHVIKMRQSTMKRMQILGVYRDVDLTEPTANTNALVAKEGSVTGIAQRTERPIDQDYTIYECYCELDIAGFEHKEKGDKEPSGLPLPYRVTIDKDSRVILEIRRNWAKDDEDYQAKIPFVAFPYTENLGFYGTGLLHRLGNYTTALTAMLRECIDAGMFASFPGFLFAQPMGRQLQNEFRVPPGGGAPIDVSAVGGDINKAVMPLPYKDVSGAMVALMGQTRENAFRYGGMANTGVAEGKQNAPVGTTLAMIEQATKIEGGVHKALHAAQAQELQLIKELFKEDPDALWRGNRRPAFGPNEQMRRQRFIAALENVDIVPASDPNVPSNMHRISKANALLTAAVQAPPGVFNMPDVYKEWGRMMKIDNIDSFILPPQQPGPPPIDPLAAAALQLKAREVATKEESVKLKAMNDAQNRQSKEAIEAAKLAAQMHGQQAQAAGQMPDPNQEAALALKARQIDQGDARLAFDMHNAHAERRSKETIKAMDLASRLATHPESQPVVNQEMGKLSDFMQPANQTAPAGGQMGGMSDGGEVPDIEPETDTHIPDSEDVAAILARFVNQLQQQSDLSTYH